MTVPFKSPAVGPPWVRRGRRGLGSGDGKGAGHYFSKVFPDCDGHVTERLDGLEMTAALTTRPGESWQIVDTALQT